MKTLHRLIILLLINIILKLYHKVMLHVYVYRIDSDSFKKFEILKTFNL